jgi:glycosyltransferase involved in cell wall biosynthesis
MEHYMVRFCRDIAALGSKFGAPAGFRATVWLSMRPAHALDAYWHAVCRYVWPTHERTPDAALPRTSPGQGYHTGLNARFATFRMRVQRLAAIARAEGVGASVRTALAYVERRYLPYRLVRQRCNLLAAHDDPASPLAAPLDMAQAGRSQAGGRIIAMLVDAFTDGGMERVTIDLCRSLRFRGYAPVILVARSAGRGCEEARRHGLNVEELGGSPARLAGWLGSVRPSLVLAHHCYFELQQFKAAGVPIVEVLHNAYFWQIGEAYVRRQRHNNVDAIVAVSDFVRDFAVRRLTLPAHKIATIRNGLDIAELVRPPLAFMTERRLQTLHAPVLVFVANLHPQKNFRGVLHSFARVRQRFPGAKLKIAGALDGNDVLRRHVKSDVLTLGLERSVEVLGLLDRKGLSQLLAEAHIGLLPTHVEGFSIVTLEYAFFALPSVLSDTGAARWLAREHEHALVVPGCAVPPERLDVAAIDSCVNGGGWWACQEIADAVVAQLGDYPAWLLRATKAAERYSSYAIEGTASRYLALMEEVLERGHVMASRGRTVSSTTPSIETTTEANHHGGRVWGSRIRGRADIL